MDRDILRKWLKSGYIETGRLFPTDLGSPQGSAISPTICNMVLDLSLIRILELPAMTAERVKGMVKIRDVTNELIQCQMEEGSDEQITKLQLSLIHI